MDILKTVIKTLADVIDPTPGNLISNAIIGRVAEKVGTTPNIVDKIISAYKEDPEITKIRIKAQEALAQLELESQKLTSGTLTSIDQRSAQDPRIIQILRGGVRPGSVILAIVVLLTIVLTTYISGILFSWITWNVAKISVLESLIKVCMWVVVSLGLGYTGLRGTEKIISIIKNGSK